MEKERWVGRWKPQFFIFTFSLFSCSFLQFFDKQTDIRRDLRGSGLLFFVTSRLHRVMVSLPTLYSALTIRRAAGWTLHTLPTKSACLHQTLFVSFRTSQNRQKKKKSVTHRQTHSTNIDRKRRLVLLGASRPTVIAWNTPIRGAIPYHTMVIITHDGLKNHGNHNPRWTQKPW